MAVLYEGHRGQAHIVHEAIARAVGAIRNGSGPTYAFGPYLSACVRSVANSLWKKQSRERPAPFEDLDPGPAEDPGLERALSLFEHEDIAVAMRTLPARWRMVLWHAEVMGEPPRKIAPLLGIESNAVSALLIRARAGLRAAYEQQSMASAETGELN